ncbi:MAG TPA: hypothetical protein VFN48_11255 [Solirubrobacteraceae bacterium]|nr:hypothetical protein [Solirubrobacteraceae bacterium]
MRRSSLAAAAASLLAAAVPATASATEVQLGQTSSPLVAPTCPPGTSAANCTILLTKMTGVETMSDSTLFPTRVKQPGVLFAMTLGISSAAKAYVSSLDKTYGGAPSAELTVLRPLGSAGRYRFQVVAQSPAQTLTAYQGSVEQFPLAQALPVVPGEIVALSTGTWAPVLAIDQSKTSFAYRQPVVATPQTPGAKPSCWQTTLGTPLSIGNQNSYGCNYAGTRIEYTATEVTTPTPSAAIRLSRRISRENRHRRPRTIRR